MNNKTYRKDLGDAELETLQKGEIDALMLHVVPRQNSKTEPEANKAGGTSTQQNTSKVSVEHKEYLESIHRYPYLSITGRAEMLGLTSYMNNKTKQDLLKKGLVKVFSVNFGHATRGNVKFLELTEAGYQAIGKTERRAKKYSCSPEHWFWQTMVRKHYAAKGYQAIIEMRLQDKRADIGLCKNDKVMAIEVELSSGTAVFNATTDLNVGFDKVLLACKNTKVKKAVQSKLEKVLDDQQWECVRLMVLSEFPFVQDFLAKSKK